MKIINEAYKLSFTLSIDIRTSHLTPWQGLLQATLIVDEGNMTVGKKANYKLLGLTSILIRIDRQNVDKQNELY